MPSMTTSSLFGALRGVRIIDVSRVLAGPYCAQLLADHGADVIKVEPPGGDDTRRWGPPFTEDAASYYTGVNRNKRGITLDLTSADARERLLALLEDADVFIENFKAGTLEKWGLGYEEVLSRRFPRLVHCRITGFGMDGPLGALPGYDAVIQGMAGLMSINGTPDSGPTRIGIPVVDISTGTHAALGIAMALNERHASGRGQLVEVALYDVALSLLHPPAANWLLSGVPQPLLGNGHPNIVPYDKFQTATCDVFIGVGNDGQFRKFAAALGRPDLAQNERYGTNPQRVRNREELRLILQQELLMQDGVALCDLLARGGVPAGPINDVGQALSHPHTQHREMLVELDGYRGTGLPVKLSRTPGRPSRRPPRLGEHNEEILGDAATASQDAVAAAGGER
ncbi:CaiB/BaiF CoA transferase family protein [Achromobacter aloeverae]